MRHIEISVRCPGTSADEAFDAVADFESHVAHADAVQKVRVEWLGDGVAQSHWEVTFRTGLLLWSERDHFDRAARSIRFAKTAGDPDHFAGAWHFYDLGEDALVRFAADFALGLASFSDVFDPLAGQAIYDNICGIVRGALGNGAHVLSPPPA